MLGFESRESDKEWFRNLIRLIAIGGIWETTWATYKKEDEGTIVVIESNLTLDVRDVEENIKRTKLVSEAIGLKFIDKREWRKV